MAKAIIPFSAFVQAAGEEHEEFINQLHEYMMENDYTVEIKDAKSGYVVSYIYKPTKRTVANYVFRKKGPLIRIYADNLSSYLGLLQELPEDMKAALAKAPLCKRMIDPTACNSHCAQGFDFILDGQSHQKCRYNAFLYYIDQNTKPHLMEIMKQEVQARKLASSAS